MTFVLRRVAQVVLVGIPKKLLFSPSFIIIPLVLHFINGLEMSNRTSLSNRSWALRGRWTGRNHTKGLQIENKSF
jgi:hypothetical protein